VTDAKLVTNPPSGSGLTHGLLDRIYEDRVAGRPVRTLQVIGTLRVVGIGEHTTADGVKRHVKFDFDCLEPVKDPNDADDIAWRIKREYEGRTGPASGQTELPLSNSPGELKLSLLAELAEWASEHGVDQDELDRRFVEMLGGAEYDAAERVNDASLTHLTEFVGYITHEADKKQTKGQKPLLVVPFASEDDQSDEDEQ
jgi:hypothetical protein